MNHRLLYITHHKLSDNNGGANASKGFLRCFAALFENCTLISHDMDNASDYLPEGVTFFPMQDHRSKVRKLFDMYRGAISGHFYFVRQHLLQHHYDVVVIDHTFTGAGLPAFIKQTGATLITIHHNVEREYLRDNSKEKPLLYRYPFLHYCRKAEKDCLRLSDLNLTVTDHDALVFRSWQPHSRISTWGIFEHKDTDRPTILAHKDDHTFVITGSLYFRQSLLPIIDFLQRYWPMVIKTYPDAKLTIAGRNPSELLKQAAQATTGVTIIPNPDRIAHVVQYAKYYVCPIYSGSGLKLRNLDGLRQGLPILCHDVAANGYERVKAAGCLFAYHDEESFMTSLHEMMAANVSPDCCYKAFQDNFSSQSGIKRLSELLHEANIRI